MKIKLILINFFQFILIGNIVQDYGDITYSPPAKKSNSLHKYEHFAVVSHQVRNAHII